MYFNGVKGGIKLKPYLEEEEIKRAKNCVNNIMNKLNAVQSELNTREHPYKTYLKEKLDIILYDTKCMLDMCNKE